ncbi:MAG: response regulator [Candidatus Paceibacterota bacterium]
MNILVIDDEEVVRDFISESLSEFGTVVTASDGPSGLKLFKCNQFDVVFTDRSMPGGMLGEEVIREIKLSSPKTFVIFMSADNREEVARVGIAAGANKIIFKPVRLESIEKAIMETITALRG